MIVEFLITLIGLGALAGSSIKERVSAIPSSKEKQWMDSVTDKELERKLWYDIHDPSKYNEIWERIERHKEAKGAFTHEPLWDKVGQRRLRFFNAYGKATKQYEGNREHGLLYLMETYEKLPHFRASWRFQKKISMNLYPE